MNKTKTGLFFLFLTLICPFFININIIFLSIMFILLGISILFFILDGKAISKLGALSSSIFFILFGLLLSITTILVNKGVLPDTFYFVTMGFGIGILFLVIFCFNLSKIISCSKKIKAEYIGNSVQVSKALILYVPLFKYNYEGVNYTNSTGQAISGNKISKFSLGHKYDININPKNPNILRINKRITFTDISLLIIGILFIIVAINALTGTSIF